MDLVQNGHHGLKTIPKKGVWISTIRTMLLMADSNSLAATKFDWLSLPSDQLPDVISRQGCMTCPST
jgi:hypothetical protein